MSTYHERDTETDFDYRRARFYDADVARFNSLDPLAADFAAWSAYNYVVGNPLYFTDPSGRHVVPTKNFKKSIYYKPFQGLKNNSIFLKYTAPFRGENSKDYILDVVLKTPSYRRGFAGWTDKLYVSEKSTYFEYTQKVGSIRYTDYYLESSPINELHAASIIIHEAMHAYFHEKGKESPHLGVLLNGAKDIGDPHHEYMATEEMVAIMVSGLGEYATQNNVVKNDGSEYTKEELKAITWRGLIYSNVNAWTDMPEEEKQSLKKQWKSLNISFEDTTDSFPELGGTPASQEN